MLDALTSIFFSSKSNIVPPDRVKTNISACKKKKNFVNHMNTTFYVYKTFFLSFSLFFFLQRIVEKSIERKS